VRASSTLDVTVTLSVCVSPHVSSKSSGVKMKLLREVFAL
jgi:hypothetical protein